MSSRSRRRLRLRRRIWVPVLLLSILGALGALAAYVLYLDGQVRNQFEGKRWALPAHVYARPLELYAGKHLSAEALIEELSLLGYRPADDTATPGSFHRTGPTMLLHTRSFVSWDGREPSRRLRLELNGGVIAGISDARSGGAVALARLDPVRIGGIYPAHYEDRILVRLDQVPKALADMLFAVEDRNFYEHHGIDPRGIGRALWANLRSARLVQGGSTITQQLAKNFFLTSERSLSRKFSEALIALLLEWRYDKREILEAYLNEIYLGQAGARAIHGFGLAAEFYFGRPLAELDVPQFALLVGLVRGPSHYDPRKHPERAHARRNQVLDIMVEQGLLSRGKAAAARRAALGISGDRPPPSNAYPAFMDLVRRHLQTDYRDEDLNSEGLRIFTTLDPLAQMAAQQALRGLAPKLERARSLPSGTLQGAVVVTAVGSGEVQALVGGRSAEFAGFNRALDAQRPIGSLIKPAIYLAALQQSGRYSAATLLDDSPLTLPGPAGKEWAPRNFDGEFLGPVPLHAALAQSRNVPAVRLGLDIGIETVLNTLYKLGLGREMDPYPSMLLGAVALSPLEVAQIYQTLADGGFYTPLRAIRAVVTQEGEVLQRYPLATEQRVDASAVYIVNTLMQEAVREGTASSLAQTLPPTLGLAGKTGTTNDLRDSWFAGFGGDRIGVVWLGVDDNSSVRLTGASGALQVWGQMMRRAGIAPWEASPPSNVEYMAIDAESGLRADEGCSNARALPFVAGSAPEDWAPCAQQELGAELQRTWDRIRELWQ